MLASDIITEVAQDLLDDTHDRWEESLLLDYLNSGERQIVFFNPTAYVYTGVYQLIAGTKQHLPDGTGSYQTPSTQNLLEAIELIRISRNMGSDGLTAGESIYPVSLQDMEEVYPGWRSATASATVLNYIFDPKDRNVFEVYPSQPGVPGWVEAIYSAVPSALTLTTQSINLGSEYVEPLKNYILFRAYSLDGATSQFAGARASAHWNLFLSQIGRKDLIESRYKARNDNSNQPV